MDKKEIKEAFIKYVETQKEIPSWSYQFTDALELDAGRFYDFYPSLSKMEVDIWKDMFNSLLRRLESEPSYQEYTAREKMLAFYFTLIDIMSQRRVFITILYKRLRLSVMPSFLKSFRAQYMDYVTDLIRQAKSENEALSRPVVDEFYEYGLWWQCQFIIWFWTRDQSEGFELTDAAIERAVHLSFDLMGPTPLDSLVSFAKFLYQSR